jgi:hypothetical protein
MCARLPNCAFLRRLLIGIVFWDNRRHIECAGLDGGDAPAFDVMRLRGPLHDQPQCIDLMAKKEE